MAQAELLEYIEGAMSENTRIANTRSLRKFTDWLAQPPRSFMGELTDVDEETMDLYIGQFMIGVRTVNGTDYEPDSLTALHRGISRSLELLGYSANIVTSAAFKISRDILSARKKTLKKAGKGNHPNRAEELTVDDEAKLWETGQLGVDNPRALQRTVWYHNTKYLGLRGNNESEQMRFGDIVIKTRNGMRYLEWNERSTKTRTGESTHSRAYAPKIFEDRANLDRCPVRIFKLFTRHRHQESLAPETSMYLAINHMRRPDSFVWYMRSKLGINHLKAMIPIACMNAGIVGKKTNHSVRRAMCSQLLEGGVPPTAVAHLSGHKRLESLNNYHHPGFDMQYGMYQVLRGEPASNIPSLKTNDSGRLSISAANQRTATDASNSSLPEVAPRPYPNRCRDISRRPSAALGTNPDGRRSPIASTSTAVAVAPSPTQTTRCQRPEVQPISNMNSEMARMGSPNLSLTQNTKKSVQMGMFSGATIHGGVTINFGSSSDSKPAARADKKAMEKATGISFELDETVKSALKGLRPEEVMAMLGLTLPENPMDSD